jgi:hypothetical protein
VCSPHPLARQQAQLLKSGGGRSWLWNTTLVQLTGEIPTIKVLLILSNLMALSNSMANQEAILSEHSETFSIQPKIYEKNKLPRAAGNSGLN